MIISSFSSFTPLPPQMAPQLLNARASLPLPQPGRQHSGLSPPSIHHMSVWLYIALSGVVIAVTGVIIYALYSCYLSAVFNQTVSGLPKVDNRRRVAKSQKLEKGWKASKDTVSTPLGPSNLLLRSSIEASPPPRNALRHIRQHRGFLRPFILVRRQQQSIHRLPSPLT